MGPKPILVKNDPTTEKKSGLISTSRLVSRPDNLEGGEETEIAVQISIPQDGGWGWVVLIAATMSALVLDGICFTYGSLMNNIASDLNLSDSLTTLVNSVAVAIYFIGGPFASAFINRFGFRACIMLGSILSSFSLLISYFTTSFTSLVIFYGGFAGFGYCLINLSSGLIVGFYFEKLRAIALSVATCGSSIGIMIFSPINTYLVSLGGWRTTTLLHSGLFGLIFFFGMAYQPLLSFTVTKTADDPTRTVTYLPTLSTTAVRHTATKADGRMPTATATERLFSAVSNYNFPTAAAVVDEGVISSSAQPGPSTAAVSKLTLTANAPQGGISKRNIKQMQSIMSKNSLQDKGKAVEITLNVKESAKTGCCGNLCTWERHISEARPMYRDDAFYDGKLENLPVYQKSKMHTATSKSGLEYQLAVTRAATAVDIKERRGVFTTAARRILATMMDPKLLKKKSFICFSFVGFLIYVGILVPYVYLVNKNIEGGNTMEKCTLLVSAIGLSNAIGRLILGILASKIDPLNLYTVSIVIAGLATVLSNLSFDLYFQYAYCLIFGFFISSVACLRGIVLVSLYGLDNLTNATGIILLFQGVGSLFSTPIAAIIKDEFGYSIAFIVAGVFMTLGGILVIPVKVFSQMEAKVKFKKKARVLDQRPSKDGGQRPSKDGVQRLAKDGGQSK